MLPGSSPCATKRMSGLSTPIPKALVATMTSTPAREEALLGLAALLIGKPRVVHAGAQAHAGEHAPPEVDGLSRRGVQDARQPHLAHEPLQDQAFLLGPRQRSTASVRLGRSKPVTSSSGVRRPS